MSMLQRHHVSCGSGRCDPFKNHSCRHMAWEVWHNSWDRVTPHSLVIEKDKLEGHVIQSLEGKWWWLQHIQKEVLQWKRGLLGQFYSVAGGKTTSIIWEACKQCQPLGHIPELWGWDPGICIVNIHPRLFLGSLKFENHHKRCLWSEQEKQIRCSKGLNAFCKKVLRNFQLVFIIGIFALNTWFKVGGARVKLVTGHKRVDFLHLISVEIYGPSPPDPWGPG